MGIGINSHLFYRDEYVYIKTILRLSKEIIRKDVTGADELCAFFRIPGNFSGPDLILEHTFHLWNGRQSFQIVLFSAQGLTTLLFFAPVSLAGQAPGSEDDGY